jgi:radical SAM protein with 4Fe4S-binding SPASM domain
VKAYAAPLRLTWDWDWPPIARPAAQPRRPSADTVLVIGAEIVRARVLMLEVGYPDPEALRSGELAAALAGFEGNLSLVLSPGAADELADTKPWEALGAEDVWVDMTPDVGAIPPALASWGAQRFYLTAGNLERVAAGIERAAAAGATAISLPNLPLFGDVLRAAEAATPPAGKLAWLAGRIAAALAGRPAVDLRVHHYGLWQALRAAGAHPHGEGLPGAGCQAGNALAYIDPAGILYPCASLPVPLARVNAGAIAAAWGGPSVAALREGIAQIPALCADCDCAPTCRGGCRGWAHYLASDWVTPGPDCARP